MLALGKGGPEFAPIVRRTLAATRIYDLVKEGPAVVWERVARGGGATNWFYCRGPRELAALEERLRPGSLVWFYFDGRIRGGDFSPQLLPEMEKMIADAGPLMVGTLAADGIAIEALDVGSMEELSAELPQIDLSGQFFYGPYSSVDDRLNVAVTLPDSDGVLRSHPH